jgi:hypothetical protein
MQKLCGVGEPCYGAIFARELYHRRITAAPNWQPRNTATSGSKPRLPFG